MSLDSFPQPAIEKPDRKTVKRFSKEHAPEEREKLAAELRVKRKEYFDTSYKREAIIASLVQQAESKEIEAAEVVEKIQEIELNLRERKESKIKALLFAFDSARLERDKADLEVYAQDLVAAQTKLRELTEEVSERYVDEQALAKARKQLSEFYGTQEKAWVEYQEAERTRDVKNVMRTHAAYIVHAIKDKIVPNDNSLLRHGTTFEKKLDILLAFEPTISTSSIQKGDSVNHLWERTGVLLSGGRVLAAYSGDAGTVARGVKERFPSHESQEAPYTRIGEDLDRSINRRGDTRYRYNELVVENPEITALYFCVDEKSGVSEFNSMSVDRMLEIAKETELPLYAMADGVVYEMSYDTVRPNWKEIILKRPIPPEEIASRAKSVAAEQRATLENRILEHSPFRLISREAHLISQRIWAQSMYVQLFAEQLNSVSAKRTEIYQGEDFSDDERVNEYGRLVKGVLALKKGDEIEVLDEIHSPDGGWEKILRFNSQLFELEQRAPYNMDQAARSDEPRASRLIAYDKRPWTGDSNYYLMLNAGGFNLGRPARKETFIEDVYAQVAYCEQQIKKIKDEKPDADYYKVYENSINDIAFYLYGFGEEAEKLGDTENCDKAWGLAAGIMPLEQIREVIKRRVNEKGGYRITREELEK